MYGQRRESLRDYFRGKTFVVLSVVCLIGIATTRRPRCQHHTWNGATFSFRCVFICECACCFTALGSLPRDHRDPQAPPTDRVASSAALLSRKISVDGFVEQTAPRRLSLKRISRAFWPTQFRLCVCYEMQCGVKTRKTPLVASFLARHVKWL